MSMICFINENLNQGSDFMQVLETSRLYLRNLRLSDSAGIYDYRNNEECSRYQRWNDFTEEEIKAFIERYKDDVFLSDKDEQHFAIGSKNTGELVGELAYFYSPNDCITLGITISYWHHKKGFAFEMLTEVIKQVRWKYPTLDIVALIEPENAASIGLFEKLGFEKECYAESISSYVYVLSGV